MNKQIKAVIFDFDGVFTNGKVFFLPDGTKFKSYNVKDGMALKLLRDYEIPYFMISGDNSKSTEEIAKHLKFTEYHTGIENKYELLKIIISKHNLKLDQIMYVGDDINDLEIMKDKRILSACPNDAIEEVLEKVVYISPMNGGNGAVRDIIENMILNYDKYKSRKEREKL